MTCHLFGNKPLPFIQCWLVVNWALGNKILSNLVKDACIFMQENTFQNVLCKMSAIMVCPQCVKHVSNRHIGLPKLLGISLKKSSAVMKQNKALRGEKLYPHLFWGLHILLLSTDNGLLPDCTKPSPVPVLTYCEWNPNEHIWMKSRWTRMSCQ